MWTMPPTDRPVRADRRRCMSRLPKGARVNTGRVLGMTVRKVDMTGRIISGLAVPYDSTSYLTEYGSNGERVLRGAFNKSISDWRSGNRPINLFRNHMHDQALGRAVKIQNTDNGLATDFYVPPSVAGDALLSEVDDGLLPGMSVGYAPIRQRQAQDGANEVQEAKLLEVSMVTIPAFDGTTATVRAAQADAWWTKPLPIVDLSPLMPLR